MTGGLDVRALVVVTAVLGHAGTAIALASGTGRLGRGWVALAALFYAAEAPLWCAIVREGRGDVATVSAMYETAGAAMMVLLAWWLGREQTTIGWVGLALIAAGVALRSID